MWPTATLRLEASTPGGGAFRRSRVGSALWVCTSYAHTHTIALPVWLNVHRKSLKWLNPVILQEIIQALAASIILEKDEQGIQINTECTAKYTWDHTTADFPSSGLKVRRQDNLRKPSLTWTMLKAPPGVHTVNCDRSSIKKFSNMTKMTEWKFMKLLSLLCSASFQTESLSRVSTMCANIKQGQPCSVLATAMYSHILHRKVFILIQRCKKTLSYLC